jgi:hypothetical protein
MISLLTALTLSCPLSTVLAEGEKTDALHNMAAKLLCDFFGLPNRPSDKDRNEGDHCVLAGIERGVTQNGAMPYQVEHLIATIADPKDSRLDYLFDRNLDAIQRAIEVPGYVLDRYWLPWKRQQNPQTQGLTVPPQPLINLILTSPDHVGTLPSRMRRDYTRAPGVVLFRQINGGGGKLLVLFLVGETPTRGIHKTAFLNALDQIQQLPTWLTVPNAPIRVLGPTFSGSAASLAISLRNWLDGLDDNDREHPKVQIISGSATAIDKATFDSLVGHDERVTFYSTVPHEHDAWCAFMQYLVRIDAGAARCEDDSNQTPTIAILSEANTIYGQVVRDAFRKKDTSTLDKPPTRSPILSLTFPLHISQLRAEVAKTRPVHSEITNVMPIQPQNEVSLPMDEGGEPKPGDVVPLFSPLETASTELVLSKMLSALQHEPIHYIGVFATDVQDRIFLTHELRRHVPNATLFTFNIDLLYLHSEAILDFQGMLVITPYTLFSRNQLWGFPFHSSTNRLMQFPTQGAQGWYNATLALLGKSEQMIEYGPPYAKGSQGALYSPVNWLSIVGRSDIWPVRILPPTPPKDTANTQNTGVSSLGPLPAADTRLGGTANTPELQEAQRQAELTSYTYVPPPDLRPDTSPTDSSTCYLSLSIWILWFVGLVCLIPSILLASNLVNNAKRWINQLWLAQLFSFHASYSYEQRVYLFACCLSLLMISLMISVVSLLPALIGLLGLGVPWDCNLLLRIIPRAMLASIPLLLLAIAIRLLTQPPNRKKPRRGQWPRTSAVFTLAISLGMFALACIALYRVVINEETWPADGKPFPATAFFFFLRTVEFRSGVSLLLPWFLINLAAFLAFFSVVRRLDLAERSYDFYLHFATDSFASLHKLEKQVRELLICPIFAVPGAFLLMLIGVSYIYYSIWHRIPSIEGVWFDWFFVVAFCLVPLLLAWMFLRFFWLALALRRVLKRLGWHPLFQEPIDDKDQTFRMLPKISLLSSAPTYTTLAASVTLAQGFFRLLDTATVNEGVKKSVQKLHTALEEEADGMRWAALKPRREAQKAVLKASRAIAAWMEPHWTALHDESSRDRTLIQQGRLCLLSQAAAFVQHILVHLQSLAGLVTAGLLLLLMAETSYPFQPHERLLLFGWVPILIVVAVTILIFVQLSRDKVISLLSGTTPNKLNWTRDFIFRVLMHGVLPILILLGIQFPEVLQNLLSWFSSLTSKGP